jgi:hypothetical protein
MRRWILHFHGRLTTASEMCRQRKIRPADGYVCPLRRLSAVGADWFPEANARHHDEACRSERRREDAYRRGDREPRRVAAANAIRFAASCIEALRDAELSDGAIDRQFQMAAPERPFGAGSSHAPTPRTS